MKPYWLVLLLLLVSCTQPPTEVELQYQQHLTHFLDFFQQQNEFAQQINESYFEPEQHNEAVEGYLTFLEENRDELEDFKLFIEENYEALEAEGHHPVLIRDIIKIVLENEQADSSFFQRCSNIFERYNEESATL